MPRTLAIANQKGGVAKTTTVASLGTALSDKGLRVLLVDLDPQSCLTFSMGVDPEETEVSLHQVLLRQATIGDVVLQTEDGPDLVPATIELAGAEAALLARPGREHALREALDGQVDGCDWVLLDCPPTLGVLTVAALSAADAVMIPLQCETLSHRGVGQLLDTIHDVRRYTNTSLEVLGVLPTLFDSRPKHSRAVLETIASTYDVTVLEPAIPRSIRFAEAPALGRSIFRTARTSRGAKAYQELADRLAG